MYLIRADIEAALPLQFITDALDDDGDHAEDIGLYDKLAAKIQAEIDGELSRRYTLPLSTVPARLRSGAADLFCELLYKRRGIASDQNPHTAAASTFRTWLESVANGATSLLVGATPARPSISIISAPAGTVPSGRLNG